MTEAVPEGPYCNDDGDWWVPVEGIPFKKARELVVGCLDYSIPDDGTLIYRGKEMAWLDDEHEGHYEGDDECPSNRHALAWRFEANPRW